MLLINPHCREISSDMYIVETGTVYCVSSGPDKAFSLDDYLKDQAAHLPKTVRDRFPPIPAPVAAGSSRLHPRKMNWTTDSLSNYVPPVGDVGRRYGIGV